MRFGNRISMAIVATALSPAASLGQRVAPSQLGNVVQHVAAMRIEVTYRRPVARGRTLFGSLVRWGAVWTPSADSAAYISFSTPVTVNGRELAAGAYGIWAIPDSLSWTLIFSDVPHVFHTRYPEGHDVLRVQSAPRATDHVETLQFSFPLVDADSAVMELRWGTTAVPLTIKSRRDLP